MNTTITTKNGTPAIVTTERKPNGKYATMLATTDRKHQLRYREDHSQADALAYHQHLVAIFATEARL